MLLRYVQAALATARYEILDNEDPFYGEIPPARAFGRLALPSRSAPGTSRKHCRDGSSYA